MTEHDVGEVSASSLHELVTSALSTMCDRMLKYHTFIRITGTLSFNIDDQQETFIDVCETVKHTQPISHVADNSLSESTNVTDDKNDRVHCQVKPDVERKTSARVKAAQSRRGRPRVKAIKGTRARKKLYTVPQDETPLYNDAVTTHFKEDTQDADSNSDTDIDTEGLSLTGNTAQQIDTNRQTLSLESQDRASIPEDKEHAADAGDRDEGMDEDKKHFACDKCNFTTDHSGHYKRHVARRHSDNKERSQKCENCDKSFYSADELKRHVKKVHDVITMQCPHCEEQFVTAGKLKKHLREEHNVRNKMLSCASCSMKFITEALLQQHVDIKHNNKCSVCSETFTNSRALRVHCDTTHPDMALSCTICGRRFTTRGALRRHLSAHAGSGRPRVSCDQCDKSFTSTSTLYHHKRAIHSAEKPYRCELCNERFNFNHSLKLHVLKHAGRRPHSCMICGKSYLTASHLKYHIEAIHTAVKRFMCTVCGKAFPYETSFKLHKMLHAGDRPYTCSSCGKSFLTRGALREHEEGHTGDGDNKNRYCCDVCNRMYRTPALLRAHSRRHTSDISRHVCEVCGRTFMYRSNLETHATVHTSERAFPCTVCGKSFKTPATLYTHRLIHRTDLAPTHVCTTCGKSFKTKIRLHAHESRHTGIKPYRCRVCGGTFPDRGGLSKHAKTVHAARPRFACPTCGKVANRLDNLRVHMRTHGDPSLLSLTAEELTTSVSEEVTFIEKQQDLSVCQMSEQITETAVPQSVAVAPELQGNSFSFVTADNLAGSTLDGQLTRVAGYQTMDLFQDSSAYVRHCLGPLGFAPNRVFVTADFAAQPDQSQAHVVQNLAFMPQP